MTYRIPPSLPCEDPAIIQGRIHHGRIEVHDPIPAEWEGRLVKIAPLTPDDPMPDLEERLAHLEKLGPMEFEHGEREHIQQAIEEMDKLSRDAMSRIPGTP